MANYQESTILGQMSQYTRCHTITIQNPRGEDLTSKNARFDEEVVKTLPDGTEITAPGEGVTAEFDPTEIIARRNPQTWELTGESFTAGDLYADLASAYWHYAMKRDDAAA
ncbi:MAG: hypothetical protein EOM24_37065 [Chloroflexia bacterium]|nr:hypothetical protein [Chloroflexia bacterium]